MNIASVVPEQEAHSSSPKKRNYRGLTPDQRTQQRRDRLIEASIHVFGTRGLHQTKMRDICNEAHLAERYFSEHFADVSQAYEAVFQCISEQALATIGTAMNKVPLTTRDIATAGLLAFFQFVKKDPRRAQILLIDAPSYWSQASIRTHLASNKHAWMMARFAELLYPGLPFKRIDLGIIGASLIGAVLQSCLTWAQGGFKPPAKTVVQHLIFMWDGLDAWLSAQIEADRSNQAPQAPAYTTPGGWNQSITGLNTSKCCTTSGP